LKIFELFGSVLIENDKANKSLDETDIKSKKVADSLDNAIKTAAKWGAIAIGAFTAVAGVASVMIKEYAEAEQAHTRLESIARTVAKATDAEIDSLKNLAKEMQNVTTYAEDVVVAGQSQLLSFGLTTEQTKQLTGSLTDLLASTKGVSASQEDAINAANMLGKAFSGQSGALTRAGILLDDTQKKILETGSASQRSAVLVDILNQNYGGLAKDLKGTVLGTLESLKNSFNDIKQTIGAELAPIVADLAKKFADKMPEIEKSITGFVKIATPVLEVLGATILFVAEHLETLTAVAAFALYTFLSYKAIAGIFFIFDNLAKITAFLTTAKAALAATNLALSGSFVALGGSLLTVLPYILMVVAALGALYGIVQLVKGGSKLDMGATLTTDLSKFTQGSMSPMQSSPTTTNRNSTNNYNVNVSAKDVKEFSDMAEFFNSVPRLSRGY
jgi:hypothetical protein